MALQKNECLVVGLDPALANLGMVRAVVDTRTLKVLRIDDMKLVRTAPTQETGIIKNHDRMRRGRELLQEIRNFCYQASLTFAEIPEGSKSSDAAAALAMTMGILCACPNRLVEVRPREVKAITGFPTADKERMRQWAFSLCPNAPWLEHRGKRVAANEHLADALATLVAGIHKPEFRRLVGALTATEMLSHRRKLAEEPQPQRRKLHT